MAMIPGISTGGGFTGSSSAGGNDQIGQTFGARTSYSGIVAAPAWGGDEIPPWVWLAVAGVVAVLLLKRGR